MKKLLAEFGCSQLLTVLSVCEHLGSTAGPIFEYTTARPAQRVYRLPALEASPMPAATPASKPHQPSPAESAVAQFTPTNDPKEIVRRSMEIDRRTLDLARNYTCQQREVIKHLDKQGNVKSTEVKTYDDGFYYGEEYSRLIMKDDKPLDDKEKKKEDEKLEKFLAKPAQSES